MAFQSVPNCASVAIHCELNGSPEYNVLNFYKAGGYEPADITDLADNVDDWVAAQYLATMVPSCNYVGCTARGLELSEDTVEFNGDATGPGESSGTVPLPSNVTVAIKFSTGLSGRSARGRAYIIGMPTLALDANENYISTTTAGTYITVFEALNGYLVGTGWVHTIVSRYTNGAKRTTGINRPVTGYSFTDRKVDTVRRRMKAA